MGVSIEAESNTEILLSKKINEWIEYCFEKSISTSTPSLPGHVKLIYKTTNGGKITFKVESSGFLKETKIEGLSEENTWLNRPSFDKDDINDINKNILILLITVIDII